MTPRQIATQIVLDVQEHGAYANIALAKSLRKFQLEDRDRRFCTELTYGTIKAGKSIDWFIENHLKNRKLVDSPEEVRAILRVGAYQLLFMTRVPKSAAVNESTELVRSFKLHDGIVKFVNGVLRNCAREIENSTFEEIIDKRIPDQNAKSIALKFLHPIWLVEHWIEIFGIDETIKLCKFDNQDPPLSLRVNTLKSSRDEILKQIQSAEPSKISPEGIILKDHGALNDFNFLKDGILIAQDESSQLVAHVLDPKPDESILDACSAPGGKSTHIAALIQNRGKIVACDSNEKRIELVKQNAERLGCNSIVTICADARNLGRKYPQEFDRVLVDAPCSGLGVLRRKPDARWKKFPKNLKELPELQFEILESCARCVKIGGTLVYSTCTMESAENEDLVAKFLDRHSAFKLISTRKLLPTIDGTDGFFIARIERIS